jgi:hypothetical protein
VVDAPELGFERNAFAAMADIQSRAGPAPLPGLSFFDRIDQQDHIKLHLPYIWRSAPGINLLFTAPLNRPRTDGLGLLSGLVETDWYASPVNLVWVLPPAPRTVHVAAGEIVAQVIAVPAALRQPRAEALEGHRREAINTMKQLRDWRDMHERDRSAYKRLSRSRHGRLEDHAS